MLDLFAGLGGASEAFRRRGWRVVTVEIDAAFGPDVVADLSAWSWTGECPDFVWASPPCTEFARESMPWCRTGNAPSLALVEATRRVIAECAPTFWCMENVRGAVPWLGQPRQRIGPFYLWGDFPPVACHVAPFKERLSSKQRAERAKVPYALSAAMCDAVEAGAVLLTGGRAALTKEPK